MFHRDQYLAPCFFIIYMNDIHTVSDKFSFILYADDTILISPLCSFSHCSHNDMNYDKSMINLELTKISDWLAVNKLSLNAAKTTFMLFHDYQKIMNEDDIPHLTINDTVIGRTWRQPNYPKQLAPKRGSQSSLSLDPNLTWWAYRAISLLFRPGILPAGGLISPLSSPAFDGAFDHLQLIRVT